MKDIIVIIFLGVLVAFLERKIIIILNQKYKFLKKSYISYKQNLCTNKFINNIINI